MYTQVLDASFYMKRVFIFDVATKAHQFMKSIHQEFRRGMQSWILLVCSFSKDERNVFKVIENQF